MRTLFPQKGESAGGPALPRWHPNFRDYDRLPDVKTVRTSLVANGVAIVIACAALGFVGLREYSIHSLNREAVEWDARIEENRLAGAGAVGEYRKFQADEKKVGEVERFLGDALPLSSLLDQLAAELPEGVTLNQVDVRATTVVLRGSIGGEPEVAAGISSAYVAQLKADPVLGVRFPDVRQVSLTRNPASGRMAFEISLEAPPPPKPAPKP